MIKSLLTVCLLAFIYTISNAQEGVLTDPRDDREYKTIQLDDQVWMAENLNFEMEDSWCYDNQTENCEVHGRLYSLSTISNACPEGWAVPNAKEWDALIDSFGGPKIANQKLSIGGKSGFNAIPSGSRYYVDDVAHFSHIKLHGEYWSNTMVGDDEAWVQNFFLHGDELSRRKYSNKNAYSIRCIKGNDSSSEEDDGLIEIEFEEIPEEYIPEDREIFTIVEQMPEFPGGQEALMNFLLENVKYPNEAIKQGIEGKVFLRFVVNYDGSISDIVILRDIGGGCGEEGVRLIKSMPIWAPGKQRGKLVNVYFTVPIIFSLGN